MRCGHFSWGRAADIRSAHPVQPGGPGRYQVFASLPRLDAFPRNFLSACPKLLCRKFLLRCGGSADPISGRDNLASLEVLREVNGAFAGHVVPIVMSVHAAERVAKAFVGADAGHVDVGGLEPDVRSADGAPVGLDMLE